MDYYVMPAIAVELIMISVLCQEFITKIEQKGPYCGHENTFGRKYHSNNQSSSPVQQSLMIRYLSVLICL